MAAKQQASEPITRASHTSVKITKFEAPKELAPEFGVQFAEETHIQGVVGTENVRALLDAFGLAERKDISFPFQHLKKGQGEIWSMRIEPSAGHTLNGSPVVGHQWIYHQAMPERVGTKE